MKQKRLVSMIGALIIMISVVSLITGCKQQNSDKDKKGTTTTTNNSTTPNKDGTATGNTSNTAEDFSPFVGPNDESLWKSKDGTHIYVQKGTVYGVDIEGDNVTSVSSDGTVKNGKIVFKDKGEGTKEVAVSIEGNTLKVGLGSSAKLYDRETNIILVTKVKKAISGT